MHRLYDFAVILLFSFVLFFLFTIGIDRTISMNEARAYGYCDGYADEINQRAIEQQRPLPC